MRFTGIVRSTDGRLLLFWCLAGFFLRLAALPFAMTTEADAVSRILSAQLWMEHPVVITSGVWGPLHYYLIALSLFIYPDPVYAPALLNIVFCVATVPPLYFFVKEEFDDESAYFIPCLYLFCPIVFWTSLMALAEIPSAFFLAATMLFVSRAAKKLYATPYSIAGGISLTLAAMLRYEAWVLIPAFAVVLWRRPKQQLLFGSAALLFPVFWMACSYSLTGNPLQYLEANENWLFLHEGMRKTASAAEFILKFFAFHHTVLDSLTPLICSGAVFGLLLTVQKRRGLLWAIPCCAMYSAFLWKGAEGSMLLRMRYFVTLLLLCLPFAACAGGHLQRRGVKKHIIAGGAIGFFLLCCCLPLMSQRLASRIPGGLYPVPHLPGQDAMTAEKLRGHIVDKDTALISDFFNWDRTFYVVLMTRIRLEKIFIFPGTQKDSLDANVLKAFLKKNPKGLLLLKESSGGSKILKQYQHQNLSQPEPHLMLTLLEPLSDLTLYSYSYQ